MRALKILAIVIAGAIGVLVLALIGVWLFVNPNDYKGRIEQTVQTSTGRQLTLAGDLKLSVFPWIALQLGPATLGNPPGFSGPPFASVQHIAVRVRLLPLLHKQLEIGNVDIDGMALNLKKNSQGIGNWETSGQNKPATTSGSSGSITELGGLTLTNSRLSYEGMTADHIDLIVGRLAAGTPSPVKLRLDLKTAPNAAPLPLEASFVAAIDTATQRYAVSRLELQGTLKPQAAPQPVHWALSARELALDLHTQALSAPEFSLQLGSARLGGAASGTHVMDAPQLSGRFKLEPVALRAWMGELGMPAPVTRDPRALSRFAASGDFTYGSNAAAVNQLSVQLDDSTLSGNAGVINLTTMASRFALSIDRLDVDRYLSPAPPKGPAQAAPTATAARSPQSTELPEWLRTLHTNGTLNIGSVTVAGLKLSELHVGVNASGGVTRLAPATAKLYGGQYSGEVTLDEHSSVPVLTLNQNMSNVQIAPLAHDFAHTDRLSGQGNLKMQLTGRGRGSDALLATLSGHVAADLQHGAIKGIDLWGDISRAVALLQKQAPAATGSGGATTFDVFKASADVKDGVATTHDLNISSPYLRVTGQGTANLVSDAINYQVKATLLQQPAAAGKANVHTLADIPVNITGTLSSPSVRPDLAALARGQLQQAIQGGAGGLQKQLQDRLKSLIH